VAQGMDVEGCKLLKLKCKFLIFVTGHEMRGSGFIRIPCNTLLHAQS